MNHWPSSDTAEKIILPKECFTRPSVFSPPSPALYIVSVAILIEIRMIHLKLFSHDDDEENDEKASFSSSFFSLLLSLVLRRQL